MVNTANNNQTQAEEKSDITLSADTEKNAPATPTTNHLYLFQFSVDGEPKPAIVVAPSMERAQGIAQKELDEKFSDVSAEDKKIASGSMIQDSVVAWIAQNVLGDRLRIGWYDGTSGQTWSVIRQQAEG